MDNMMPGYNPEPPEGVECPRCDGTGLEPEGVAGEVCSRCEGLGVVCWEPDDVYEDHEGCPVCGDPECHAVSVCPFDTANGGRIPGED